MNAVPDIPQEKHFRLQGPNSAHQAAVVLSEALQHARSTYIADLRLAEALHMPVPAPWRTRCFELLTTRYLDALRQMQLLPTEDTLDMLLSRDVPAQFR